MVRRLGLGKNNHLTYASLALNPRSVSNVGMSFVRLIIKQNLCLEIAMWKFLNMGYRKYRNLCLANSVAKNDCILRKSGQKWLNLMAIFSFLSPDDMELKCPNLQSKYGTVINLIIWEGQEITPRRMWHLIKVCTVCNSVQHFLDTLRGIKLELFKL